MDAMKKLRTVTTSLGPYPCNLP